jgi:hypothetical protein
MHAVFSKWTLSFLKGSLWTSLQAKWCAQYVRVYTNRARRSHVCTRDTIVHCRTHLCQLRQMPAGVLCAPTSIWQSLTSAGGSLEANCAPSGGRRRSSVRALAGRRRRSCGVHAQRRVARHRGPRDHLLCLEFSSTMCTSAVVPHFVVWLQLQLAQWHRVPARSSHRVPARSSHQLDASVVRAGQPIYTCTVYHSGLWQRRGTC